MNMGPRSCGRVGAPLQQNVKDVILAASELDTRLVMRPVRNTERVLANAGVERLLEKERALGDAIGLADIAPEVAGVYPRVMRDGDMDAGAWRCGMVAGLIHDIPTVGEIVARIMSEERTYIAGRLAGLVDEPRSEERGEGERVV